MRTRSFTLTLIITQYTLLLMHLWKVWKVFTKMKILNQVKFYTLNEKSTKVIISPKRAFCRSHHWWFPSGLNLTLCCNVNAINWRQAVTEDTRSSLTSMMTFLCVFHAYLRPEEADWGAPGSDRAQPLGGDPAGGLQARARTRGDQTLAESRQTWNWTGRGGGEITLSWIFF